MSCTGYTRLPLEVLVLLAFLPKADSPSSDSLSVAPRICLHGHKETEQNLSIKFDLESCTITRVICSWGFVQGFPVALLTYRSTAFPKTVCSLNHTASFLLPTALLNDIAELQKQARLFKTPNNPWCPMFSSDHWTIIISSLFFFFFFFI